MLFKNQRWSKECYIIFDQFNQPWEFSWWYHASVDKEVKKIKRFIREKRLKNVYIVGHSLGGRIAMNFAFKYPDWIKGIGVLDMTPEALSDSWLQLRVVLFPFIEKFNLQIAEKILQFLQHQMSMNNCFPVLQASSISNSPKFHL